jgi:two-component system heavy metal sensor histidine kinase CusS
VSYHFYQQDHHVLAQKFETFHKIRGEGDFIDRFGSFFTSGETKLWYVSNNQVTYSSQSIPLPNNFSTSTSSRFLEWTTGSDHYRAQVFKLDESPDSYAILGLNINHHLVYLSSIKYVILITTMVASLVSGLLGWFIVRKELTPLRQLEKHIQTISTKRLDVRIPTPHFPRELLPLVTGFNAMLDRLEIDFERISEFSSDIAHELRTPISNMMTQTHVALAKKRSAEEYQDILVSASEELARLTKTITDMLYLAKSEHNLLMKTVERFDLNLLSQELIEFYELAGEDKALRFQLLGEAQVEGDKVMLKRAIGNLLSNAVRHSNSNGVIEIKIQKNQASIEVSVSNEGDAIPPESIPHLFERFYRADKSRRHSSSSGSGLGLPIARSIAQLHNGNIRVETQEGKSTFTLSIGSQY